MLIHLLKLGVKFNPKPKPKNPTHQKNQHNQDIITHQQTEITNIPEATVEDVGAGKPLINLFSFYV
ncbi:MAG: hypothetical protein CW716_06400 [Candidatus Bathyarchaeum sp.]|nr:MAG: hypothetical protein CW716_06400 [Candidatus Bathyarchaeum sp.]